ncbi:hypothetical protein [Paenibacillus agri]|uniref:Uncharacterized protein n=1 Tax=Paenibacillus agri TaxID=2744309 RepID=A0A850ECW2_9BACL|nr:hypothetical protein [Paenibacillus agri]NUU59083.1 hypothetical protein [Paenibacillus agri]
MNRKKPYTGIITVIYTVVIIATVLLLTMLGFSDNLPRLVITLIAVLIAESVVFGYTLFWIKSAGSVSGTPPILLSGAFIIAAYAVAVVISAVFLDRLLGLPAFWYAAVQLLVLAAAGGCLALIGLYGWNAGAQENKEKQATRSLFRQRKELADIKRAARSWRHAEAETLVKRIGSVEEAFTYSDPVSRPSLFATEDMLSQQIALLRDQVELLLSSGEPGKGWEAQLEGIIGDIEATLQRRNRELAALK